MEPHCLSAAIVALQLALNTSENNAPINEAEGKWEQAQLQRDNAVEYRTAIAILGLFDKAHVVHYEPVPPIDNACVAPGCEQFATTP
jgi:hypothetical protein